MDSDHDGVIIRAEWRGSTQSFREHDVNHDGVLSGDEVWPADGRNRRDGSRRDELTARFDSADRNRDGHVARSEWTGSTAAFKRMDENGDGLVTREEFLAIAATAAVDTAGTEPSLRRREPTSSATNAVEQRVVRPARRTKGSTAAIGISKGNASSSRLTRDTRRNLACALTTRLVTAPDSDWVIAKASDRAKRSGSRDPG